MSRRQFSPSDRDRGQTLPDFAIGISIFLITVSFIIVFVPQLTLPFEDTEQPVVAERTATDLESALLSDPDMQSHLNESCTLAFFSQSGTTSCPFETDEPIETQVGIDPSYSINVSLRETPSDSPNSTRLCMDGGTIGACSGSSDVLTVGPDVPQDGQSVATSRQSVAINGTSAILEVVVW